MYMHMQSVHVTPGMYYMYPPPPSTPIHQYAAIYYHVTLNEQIHHCLHFFVIIDQS